MRYRIGRICWCQIHVVVIAGVVGKVLMTLSFFPHHRDNFGQEKLRQNKNTIIGQRARAFVLEYAVTDGAHT